MSQTGPASAGGIFAIEREDDTIIVVPSVDLRELDYERIEEGGKAILELLRGTEIKNVVLDFHNTEYFGSTALAFFVSLWKRIRGQYGHMAFCNISDDEKEILEMTKLDHLWRVCSSRIEALAAVRE